MTPAEEPQIESVLSIGRQFLQIKETGDLLRAKWKGQCRLLEPDGSQNYSREEWSFEGGTTGHVVPIRFRSVALRAARDLTQNGTSPEIWLEELRTRTALFEPGPDIREQLLDGSPGPVWHTGTIQRVVSVSAAYCDALSIQLKEAAEARLRSGEVWNANFSDFVDQLQSFRYEMDLTRIPRSRAFEYLERCALFLLERADDSAAVRDCLLLLRHKYFVEAHKYLVGRPPRHQGNPETDDGEYGEELKELSGALHSRLEEYETALRKKLECAGSAAATQRGALPRVESEQDQFGTVPSDVKPAQRSTNSSDERPFKRRGPKPRLKEYLQVREIILRIASESDWISKQDDICEALDEASIPVPRRWPTELHARCWSTCLDRHLVQKVPQ